jgi:hypothetical protein
LELLARELCVTADTRAGWRDYFLAGGQVALMSQPVDDRDDESPRLRAKVGELTSEPERRAGAPTNSVSTEGTFAAERSPLEAQDGDLESGRSEQAVFYGGSVNRGSDERISDAAGPQPRAD